MNHNYVYFKVGLSFVCVKTMTQRERWVRIVSIKISSQTRPAQRDLRSNLEWKLSNTNSSFR